MSYAKFNTSIEYGANTFEFNLFDEDNVPVNFDPLTTFNIKRIDDPAVVYSVSGTVTNNNVTFTVDIPTSLYKDGDLVYALDTPDYKHIYSIKSPTEVYIAGKLHLCEVA